MVVDISSATVFGAKSVDLIPPPNPSPRTLQPGEVLDSDHVTVEFNSIFEQLVSVLTKIQPEKLNETLGAIASAFDGRGQQFGDTLSQLDRYLAKIEPSLPNLSHDLEVAPSVLNAYADAAPDLVRIAANGDDASVRRWSTSNRTSTRSWSAPSDWPRSATTSSGPIGAD